MNYASILVKKLTISRMSQNLYVRLGFLGNQPFFTLSSCSKTSLMVQKEEKANTPNKDETSILSVLNEAATPAIPNTKKIHQHFVPQ
jgi:hypothetical protein